MNESSYDDMIEREGGYDIKVGFPITKMNRSQPFEDQFWPNNHEKIAHKILHKFAYQNIENEALWYSKLGPKSKDVEKYTIFEDSSIFRWKFQVLDWILRTFLERFWDSWTILRFLLLFSPALTPDRPGHRPKWPDWTEETGLVRSARTSGLFLFDSWRVLRF